MEHRSLEKIKYALAIILVVAAVGTAASAFDYAPRGGGIGASVISGACIIGLIMLVNSMKPASAKREVEFTEDEDKGK